MKKVLIIFVVLVFIFGVTACGGNKPAGDNDTSVMPIGSHFTESELEGKYRMIKADSGDFNKFTSLVYKDFRDYYLEGVEADEFDPDYTESAEAHIWNANDSDAWLGVVIDKETGAVKTWIHGNNDW